MLIATSSSSLGLSSIGRLEPLDERHVAQNVLGRVGEPLEQVVLELHQLDLIHDKGRLELLLLLLEVGPLDADDLGEQLVLEARLGRDEVDERALRRDLGFVVRVRELGLEVEREARVVLHLLAAELKKECAPLLVDGAREHGLERRVDLLAEVLDDDAVTVRDGRLDRAQPVLLLS